MKEANSIMTVIVMIKTVMVTMIRMGMIKKRVLMMMANRVTEMVMIIRIGPSLLVCKKVQLHNAVWVYRDGIVHLGMRHIFAKTVGLICKLDFAVCFKLHNALWGFTGMVLKFNPYKRLLFS